jgi:hypothetical protein
MTSHDAAPGIGCDPAYHRTEVVQHVRVPGAQAAKKLG